MIQVGSQWSGIDVTYVKHSRTLYVGGWYDSCVGIESKEISLCAFLDDLGITDDDIRKARAERKEAQG